MGSSDNFSPYDYEPLRTIRAVAALPAAGAWDAAPLEVDCPYALSVAFFVQYERGAAGGAVDLQVEVSPYTVDLTAPAISWFNAALYEPANVVAGVDAVSLIQREYVTYTAVGAGVETFVYQIHVAGGIQRVRIAARESGAVGTPGECGITGIIK